MAAFSETKTLHFKRLDYLVYTLKNEIEEDLWPFREYR